jgi:hypothetical protein
MREMARLFEPRHIVAETRLIGNLSGNIRVEQSDDPPDRGLIVNQAVVGLRLPF